MAPTVFFDELKTRIKTEWKIAFLSAFLIGLLVHLPVMTSDIPNHDGLDSLYFSQNMITSGRWFLSVACGFSSFYSVPWVIGLLGMFFLALAAAVLIELLQVKETWAIIGISGLLVSFPAVTSTFAYVFTLDGYMLALLLAVVAVLLTERFSFGFLTGAFCLAFSMGIYQAYLPFAMILSIFVLLRLIIDGDLDSPVKTIGKYLGMGILGAVFYYVILRVLLWIQGKELAAYQGINDMTSVSENGLTATILRLYRDFASFTLKGKVIYNNVLSAAIFLLLGFGFLMVIIRMAGKRKWWKNPWMFVIILGVVIGLPIATNVILVISPNVTYHLLMRYQWVLFPIGMIAFVERYAEPQKSGIPAKWMVCLAVFGLILFYGVTDNIAYTNLHKKYEKTYAYCLRLVDRIEQTPGYYPGIPIAMIGVVGEEQFPVTDYTEPVTGGMIGMSGDWLLYTGPNYQKFIQNYLGASLNILPTAAMEEMYYDQVYVAMDSFPGPNSIRIIDGIMYVKTENTTRE